MQRSSRDGSRVIDRTQASCDVMVTSGRPKIIKFKTQEAAFDAAEAHIAKLKRAGYSR